MNIQLDNRSILANLVKRMSDSDAQQIIAYAAGYEAGKISQSAQYMSNQSTISQRKSMQYKKDMPGQMSMQNLM